jgi:hypothetical protein
LDAEASPADILAAVCGDKGEMTMTHNQKIKKAWAAYNRIVGPAREAYERVEDEANKEYDRVVVNPKPLEPEETA